MPTQSMIRHILKLQIVEECNYARMLGAMATHFVLFTFNTRFTSANFLVFLAFPMADTRHTRASNYPRVSAWRTTCRRSCFQRGDWKTVEVENTSLVFSTARHLITKYLRHKACSLQTWEVCRVRARGHDSGHVVVLVWAQSFFWTRPTCATSLQGT